MKLSLRCIIHRSTLYEHFQFHWLLQFRSSAWRQTNDDIDFVPYRENSVLQLDKRSKTVLSTHTFLLGEVLNTKRWGRNINSCGLKGFVYIEITKVLVFVNVSLYRPY